MSRLLHIMTTDTEGIHCITRADPADYRADIVFIHGLAGSSHATWRYGTEADKDHFFWPAELGEELPHCTVWTVGYAAGFTELGNPGMMIELRAGNLADQLFSHRIGHRPLIFISHSMGGLIVKHIVVSSMSSRKESLEAIATHVRGIVFCGTPHRGSDFATAADVLLKFFAKPQDHVVEMRRNGVTLDLLHDKFREWWRRNPVKVATFAETIGLFRKNLFGRLLPLGLVVPRASANDGISEPCDVDANHLSLVKPSPAVQPIYDLVYRGVTKFIEEALKPYAPLSSPTAPSRNPRNVLPVGTCIIHVMQELKALGAPGFED